MDIWITRAGKTCECAAKCGEPINAGDPVIRGKVWLKKDGEARRWSKILNWHTHNKNGDCCWLVVGLAELEKHPREETRGRKPMDLTEAQREGRNAILRARASIMQRLRYEKSLPEDVRDMEKVARLGAKLAELKEKIKVFGGIPDGW